jgi:tRNA (adenine57-N1/adenine58-N1)-methyltransferase
LGVLLKEGEIVLLISKDESYLTEVSNRTLNIQSGIVDLKKLKKKKFGDKIKTHTGKEFFIVKPNIKDILERKVSRLPQIIMPKDAALILAYTGVEPGSLIVDAGCGSGFLAIFLAYYIKPGKIVTYEKEKRFVKVAKRNIEISGLSKFIQFKEKDVRNGIDEKNVDLVTLDMKNAERVVKHAYKALKPGGWLAVYSPYIEQVKTAVGEIKKKGFSEVKTVENIVRGWQVREHTLPERSGIMHTGFISFARKVE